MKTKTLIVVLFVFTAPAALGQDIDWGSDELRSTWENRAEWPTVEVGDLDIDVEKLIGLRAVYQRRTNLNADVHSQKAVFQYDVANWNGDPALLTIWSASGDGDKEDVSDATAQFIGTISDLETFQMRQYVGTFAGSLSYSNLTDEKSVGASVSNEGEASSQVIDRAMAGYDTLNIGQILGLYDAKHGLKAGQKFRLPYFNSSGGAIAHQEYYIRGKVKVTDEGGKERTLWDVFSLWRKDGYGGHYYVSGKAPYFWGYKLDNVVTGDTRAEVRYIDHIRMN